MTVREPVAESAVDGCMRLVGVDAGGRATATDDCGATSDLGAVEDSKKDRALQRKLSKRKKGPKGVARRGLGWSDIEA